MARKDLTGLSTHLRMFFRLPSLGYFTIWVKVNLHMFVDNDKFIDFDLVIKPDPLDAHFPTRKTISPITSQVLKASIPSLKPPTDLNSAYGADFEDYAVEIYEWLSMILLESPRVDASDNVDPFLCRYSPPGDSYNQGNIVKITWRGFLSSIGVQKLFIQLLLALPKDVWFAYNVADFSTDLLVEGKSTMVLMLPDTQNEFVLWDIS
jgi:ribonuclease P/MRP protein subunit RPP40